MKLLLKIAALIAVCPLAFLNNSKAYPTPPWAPTEADVDAPAAQNAALLAWSELGMHCDDGKDYSVFAILPPYNVVHAQVIKKSEPPQLITSGVTVTYQAMADPSGSINTISSTKTNFWNYVQPLFLASPAPDVGLAGFATQSRTPHDMPYVSDWNYFEALGIPTMSYDDRGNFAPLPMVKIVGRNGPGSSRPKPSRPLRKRRDQLQRLPCF